MSSPQEEESINNDVPKFEHIQLPNIHVPITPSHSHFKAVHFDLIPKLNYNQSIFNQRQLIDTSNSIIEDLAHDDQILKWLDHNFNTMYTAVNEKEKKKKPTVRTLLDEKKSFHMDIILRKFGKLSLQKIVQAVLDMDTTVFKSSEMMQIFYESGPDESDVEIVQKHQGPTADLAPSDQFILKLLQLNIHQFRIKMKLWKSSYDIADHIRHTRKYVEIINRACKELMAENDDSPQWKILLSLLLSLHNYINGGKKNRIGYGFNLSSLKNLKYSKSVSNHRKSLFTELIRIIEYKYPRIKLCPFELSTVIRASQMDWDVFYSNLNDINSTFDDYKQLMEYANESNDKQHHPKFYEFLEKNFNVSQDVQILNQIADEMNARIMQCQKLFSMQLTDDHSIIDEFKIVASFLSDLNETRIQDPDIKFPVMNQLLSRISLSQIVEFSDCDIICTTEKFKPKPAYTIPRKQYEMMIQKKGTNPLIDQLLSNITPDMIID
jgi:hypothetical protein